MMTTELELASLADRVEAMEVWSGKLRNEIALAVGYRDIFGDGTLWDKENDGYWNGESLPDFLSSIDAARTLIPVDHEWHVDWAGNSTSVIRQLPDGPEFRGYGRNPAIALTAAALRARIQGKK